jgi:hypothetical protein
MRSKLGVKAALVGGSACLLFLASPLHAVTANGLVVEPRVFDDFATSTETVNINGGGAVATPVPTPVGNVAVTSLPASVQINDSNLANAGGGGFANRDDILVSTDHGATAWSGNIDDGFTISANITLTDGTNSPRKEIGLRINAPVTGDAQFILDSDTGEVVAFGGGAPFFNFRPAIEATYSPGQTVFMKEQYVPGVGGTTGANPGTMEYWAELLPGGPLLDSGPLPFSNLEGGPGGSGNYQVGFYDQAQSSGAADFIGASFNNISASVVVPEPGTLSLLGLGCVTLLSRRRAAKLA